MSTVHVSLHEFEEQFPWDSEAQKKGFQALCKDLIDTGNVFAGEREMESHHRLELVMMKIAAWFIQKDHESNQWYNERIGELDKKHTDTQAQLLDRQRVLESQIEELKAELLKRR